MNKDLLIDGEKYISAKRAGQNLGYSADYIGQLARSGTVAGRIVGRTWYVSQKALLKHKRNGSGDKSPKIGRPAEGGKKDIYINGDKYVSSQKASLATGYAGDYIGQLIRNGSVTGKMMGRTWYVSQKSLLGYKKNNSLTLRSETVVIAPKTFKVTEKKFVSSIKIPRPEKKFPEIKSISYIPETLQSLPKLTKPKTISSYPRVVRNVVSVSLSLMIVAASAYAWVGYLSPNSGDQINMKIANVMDATDAVSLRASVTVASVLMPIKVGSKHIASSVGAAVKNLLSGVLTPSLPQVAKVETAAAAEGIVVTSETGSHSEVVQKIKNIFSDEVSVSEDPGSASGVITPVFAKGSSTDAYTFVLVPIKPTK